MTDTEMPQQPVGRKTPDVPGAPDRAALPFDVLTAKRRYTAVERRRLKAESRLLPRGGVARPPEPNTVRPRLAQYLRISELADDSVSIPRQNQANLAEIERLGGIYDERTDLFQDVSVSASKGHYRAGMEALLARIEDERAYDGVVIWEFPRALRNYAESLNFRNILFQASCELYIVTQPHLRLFGQGASFFDMHVQVAEGESRAMSERAISRHRYLSAIGAVRGRPMFGLRATEADERIPGRAKPIRKYVPDTEPRESLGGRSPAQMVREVYEAVVEGRSVRAIAVGWNREKLPSSRGGVWTHPTVISLIKNPTMAGLAHRGGVLLGADGEELPPGSDEPPLQVSEGVLSVSEWMAARDVLDSRRRVVRRRDEPLLRGLVFCSRCERLVSRHSKSYQCGDVASGYVRCGGPNSANAPALEEHVRTAALEVLASQDLRRGAWKVNQPDRRGDAERLEAQIAALYRQLDDIEGLWLACLVKDGAARERFGRRRRAAEESLASSKAELASLSVRSRHSELDKLHSDGRGACDAFLAAPAHLKVTILHELIERVVLSPAPKNKWHPDRVEIRWATF